MKHLLNIWSSAKQETVSRDFDPFFYLKKNSTRTPYEHWTGKTSFAKFKVFATIFAKNVCLRLVIGYADTVLA